MSHDMLIRGPGWRSNQRRSGEGLPSRSRPRALSAQRDPSMREKRVPSSPRTALECKEELPSPSDRDTPAGVGAWCTAGLQLRVHLDYRVFLLHCRGSRNGSRGSSVRVVANAGHRHAHVRSAPSPRARRTACPPELQNQQFELVRAHRNVTSHRPGQFHRGDVRPGLSD